MKKITFSGHESFHCKPLWLKKGFDYKNKGEDFNNLNAVVKLGVGKNMVASIRFWMHAFNALNDNALTDLAVHLFANNGWDPYLEDEGTLWLLHYLLVSKGYAATPNLIFNRLRKLYPEFSQLQFNKFVKKEFQQSSNNTINRDFQVFERTYLNKKTNEVEENTNSLLADLKILEKVPKRDTDTQQYFTIKLSERKNLPPAILLYCILDSNQNKESINFEDMLMSENNVGNIFALSREGLYRKLEEIIDSKIVKATFTDTAGIKIFQVKQKNLNLFNILNQYYES